MLPSESIPKCPMPSRLLFFVILGNISTPVNGFQSLLGSSKYISKKWRLASAWNEFSHWEHCPSPLTLIHQGPFLPSAQQSAVSTALTPQQICSLHLHHLNADGRAFSTHAIGQHLIQGTQPLLFKFSPTEATYEIITFFSLFTFWISQLWPFYLSSTWPSPTFLLLNLQKSAHVSILEMKVYMIWKLSVSVTHCK